MKGEVNRKRAQVGKLTANIKFVTSSIISLSVKGSPLECVDCKSRSKNITRFLEPKNQNKLNKYCLWGIDSLFKLYR